ncbi:MAG: DUF4230 domain-containing protein [Saprospiraceae bacterium]|jgi:hypothetical protein|nr:DUF4230 domain-containing protein [Saprospiraceae bacterium]
MRDNYQNGPGQPDEGFSAARLIVFLLALALLGFIAYRYYFAEGGGSYTNIPKEVQIKYVPSDFKSDIDYDNALPILANPVRYSREFEALIHDFNLSLLTHVANRMNLSDSLKIRVRQEYEKHHPYIHELMFNDFVAMRDSTSTVYNTWYQNELTSAVDVLHEVASKYTCFLINQIMGTLLPTQEGKIYVKGTDVNTPCGVALTEGLQPMIARLKERATVQDFTLSKGIFQERVEKAIAELGTMEIRDRKGIGTSKQTKVLGVDVSSTEMEMSAISILKVGFKLDKFFDVNLSSKSNIVTVTLPEPEILSHEVYPRIDKLDIGWMRELDQADFNKNMDVLRKEFRREALESDVMDKAKQRAIELMDTMMTPMIKGLNNRYELKVRFKSVTKIEDEQENSSKLDN